MDCSEVKVHTGSKGPEKKVSLPINLHLLSTRLVRLSVRPTRVWHFVAWSDISDCSLFDF